MRVHPHIPIGEIAASMPHLTSLFDMLGIDYVLHGNLSLRDACAEAGVDPARVRQAMTSIPPADKSWSDVSMQELINEIRDHRHPRAHQLLAEAAKCVAAVQNEKLHHAFNALCEVLQPHMLHEEHMFFPVVQHLEDCWTHNETAGMNFVGGVGKPVGALIHEHETIVARLRDVHEAADLLDSTPEGSAAHNALNALEHELREHIHLENNVLYPRATAIEAAVV